MATVSPIIPWKRFWCPMGQAINCGDSGRDFLSDPEHDFGRILNPSVLGLDQLLDKPCLVLCGEPGMGKSKAIELARQTIISKPGADQNPLWINFRDIPTEQVFHRKTFETAKWKTWLKSDSKLTLVVDGIDEGLIRVPNFIPYLTAELRDLPLQCLQVILVCRTAEWSLAAGKQLLGLWNVPDDNAVFELCPLRHQDARLASETWNLDADKFMSEVYTQNVAGLASRPTTLMFLLREFSLRGTFPGTHFDLYDSGCKRLCEEHDSNRLAALHYQQPAPNPFPAAEVHKMATRMAVLMMVCGKSAVYVGDKDAAEPTDLLVEQIIDAPSEKHLVYAALSTALFSARGPERFGFAHQTFAECLAAQGLRGLPLIQVRSALCQRDGQIEHVVPQLSETASWLAAMRDDFLEFVMAREPEVLVRSDVSRIQAQHKEQLVTALLERARQEDAFDGGDLRKFYSGLNHPGLASQLWRYINDPTLNYVATTCA